MKDESQTPIAASKRKLNDAHGNSAKRKMPTPDVGAQENCSYAGIYTEEEDASDETITVADNTVLNNTILRQYFLTPCEMGHVLESFFKYLRDNGLWKKSSKTFKKAIKDFVECTPINYTVEQITQAYKYYQHEAMKKMDFETESVALTKFLNSDSAVQMYPDYPKYPPSVFQHYKMMKNLSMDISKNSEHKKLMEEDLVGHRDAELGVLELQTECLQKLRDFIEAHKDDLNDEQKKFVEQKIAVLNKKLNPPDTTKTPRKKKTVTEEPAMDEEEEKPIPKTPFELYVQLQRSAPEFEGKSEKKIEKKLKKKFDSITQDEMNLLEMMFKLESKRKPV